jgi:hypothetical protein
VPIDWVDRRLWVGCHPINTEGSRLKTAIKTSKADLDLAANRYRELTKELGK